MHPTRPRRSTPALLVAGIVASALLVGGVVALVGGVLTDPAPPLKPVADRALVAPRLEVRAAHLLEAWDQRRSAAWAAGDADALDALYTVGSPAGRHDRAMLTTWSARGLRVEGLRSQVVGVTVVAHRPGRFELDVVDRVVGGTAVGPGVRRALPHDVPTRRRVVLVERSTGWLVQSVRSRGPSAGPSPAPR